MPAFVVRGLLCRRFAFDRREMSHSKDPFTIGRSSMIAKKKKRRSKKPMLSQVLIGEDMWCAGHGIDSQHVTNSQTGVNKNIKTIIRIVKLRNKNIYILISWHIQNDYGFANDVWNNNMPLKMPDRLVTVLGHHDQHERGLNCICTYSSPHTHTHTHTRAHPRGPDPQHGDSFDRLGARFKM